MTFQIIGSKKLWSNIQEILCTMVLSVHLYMLYSYYIYKQNNIILYTQVLAFALYCVAIKSPPHYCTNQCCHCIPLFEAGSVLDERLRVRKNIIFCAFAKRSPLCFYLVSAQPLSTFHWYSSKFKSATLSALSRCFLPLPCQWALVFINIH